MAKDYNKAYLYGISIKGVDIYTGSSCRPPGVREAEHKRLSKHHPGKLYQYIRDNGGWDAVTFEILEEYPCKSAQELHIREGIYIRRLQPVCNTYVAGITHTMTAKEYKKCKDKKYYQSHRERATAYNRQYYINNRERLNARRREQYHARKAREAETPAQRGTMTPSGSDPNDPDIIVS